jgi:putative NADH-flavin reductase
MLMHVSRALVRGLRQTGAGRLIVVGGAGSLLRQGGARHLGNQRFPAEYEPLALAHAQTRDYFLTVAGLDWIYASPAQLIEPGERGGVFRIVGDELLTDADGSSRITIPDYAAGIVDRLENPAAHSQQITFAC